MALTKPNPMGRPSKYEQRYCKDVVEFIRKNKGKTILHWCNSIEVHRDTALEWASKYSEFSVAYKLAIQISCENCIENMANAETPTEFAKAKWFLGALHRMGEVSPMEQPVNMSGSEVKIKFADIKKTRR